jgi:hypothetical protein
MLTLAIVTLVALLLSMLVTAPSGDAKSDARLLNAQGGWVQIAVAAVGALASARQASSDRRSQAGMTREQIAQQAEEGRRSSAFEAALADHYQQQGNERARRSLANFSRWSTVPQQDEPYYSPTAPVLPKPEDFAAPPRKKGGM